MEVGVSREDWGRHGEDVLDLLFLTSSQRIWKLRFCRWLLEVGMLELEMLELIRLFGVLRVLLIGQITAGITPEVAEKAQYNFTIGLNSLGRSAERYRRRRKLPYVRELF